MKNLLLVLAAIVLVGWAARTAPAREQEAPAPQQGASHDGASHDSVSHDGAAHPGAAHDAGPVPPKAGRRWTVPLLILILAMFLAAMVIGPIVRAQAPPEMPPTHSHDEPPGASHHHGHSGTINPVPEDVARIEHGDAHGSGHGHGH